MTDDSNTLPMQNIQPPPDDTFAALLDDYIEEKSWGLAGHAQQARESLIAYHTEAIAARDTQLDIANARIAELEARQITPDMEATARAYHAWLFDMTYPTEAEINTSTAWVFGLMTMTFKALGLKEDTK